MGTAMTELIEYIESNEIVYNKDLILKLKEGLEKEKEQIIDAFVKCWEANMPDGYECKLSAKEYYNQTYNQNK